MFFNSEQTDWDLYIPSILFAYRVSPCVSTGDSPFYLLYGREPRLPPDVSANHGLCRIVMALHRGKGNGYIIFVGNEAAFEGNDLYLGLVQQASLVYLVSCTLPLAVRVKLVACMELLRHSLPHSIQWELCNT